MMNCHEPPRFQVSVPARPLHEATTADATSGAMAASTRLPHPEILEARRVHAAQHMRDGLIVDQFQAFDRLISDYVRSVPPTAHAETDTDRFVTWLKDQSSVDAEQRDLLLCLYSRRAVETAALHKRIAHARFMELLIQTPERLQKLTFQSPYGIRLNPVHVWATFQTRVLLGERNRIPACALFYQVGQDVRTAILKEDVLPLVRTLEQRDLRIADLFVQLTPEQSEEMLAVLRHLADLQIIAIG